MIVIPITVDVHYHYKTSKIALTASELSDQPLRVHAPILIREFSSPSLSLSLSLSLPLQGRL